MMQGICIDSGQSAVFQQGTSYYLFPNGPSHYYVSNYPNENAHRGCFQKSYFEIIDKCPKKNTEHFLVIVNKQRSGYLLGDQYIVSAPEANGYFNVYLMDGRLIGSYLTNFFEALEPCELPTFSLGVPNNPAVVSKKAETVQIYPKSEQKSTNYVQLSLFDF